MMKQTKGGVAMLLPELERVLMLLPARIAAAVMDYAEKSGATREKQISELRLRADAPFSLTAAGENVCRFGGALLFCTVEELTETFQKLCEDSVHTYGETIKEGYVALENGYRIGVCGRAGQDGAGIRGVYGIRSLCIRIPHPIRGVCDELCSLLDTPTGIASALLYSPPNVGKTTMIRDLAATLSSEPRPHRVALIDTRGELEMKAMFSSSLTDILSGYPKAKGIEIATRTLSPEVILCDELGGAAETDAILMAQQSGVPLIATAHAATAEELWRKPQLRRLLEAGVFRFTVGLARKPTETHFSLSPRETEAVR